MQGGDSAEFVRVVVVDTFDMSDVSAKIALDGPVVEIKNEIGHRPFVAEDLVESPDCGGIVRFHREETKTAADSKNVS